MESANLENVIQSLFGKARQRNRYTAAAGAASNAAPNFKPDDLTFDQNSQAQKQVLY
jgi:hypothetical protein